MQKHVLTALAALCIAFATIAQAPTTGLVAYWPLNGNFSDAGPNGLHATNSGATATTNNTNAVNTAMAFSNTNASANVVNQYAVAPSNAVINFSGTQNFTVCFAFYTNATYVRPGGLFDNNLNSSGYGIWWWNDGGYKVQFNYKNMSVASNVITLGTWLHATAVRNNGTMSIYINGVLNNSTGEGTQTPTYTLGARFGTMHWSGYTPPQYNGHNGKLDELRIYNRALSAAEITQTYNAWFNGALPVKLTSFTATKTNSDVLLNWQTAYEQNSSHFNVQRSTDGINFNSISTIPAKGNSSLPTNYQLNDNTAKDLANVKTVFYRLQMVDMDASKVNSGTAAVKLDTEKRDLTILQNPAGNDLRIMFSSSAKEIAQITITDNSGRQLLTKQIWLNIGTVSTVVPVSVLAAGNYYITVTSTQGKQTKAFFKQ